MFWTNLIDTVVVTAEVLRVPLFISLVLMGLSLVLYLFPRTRVAGAYLGFALAGALTFSAALGLVVFSLGLWWLDANPEMSLGNDGPGLLVGMAYMAALPIGGSIGLLVGVMHARKATNRRPIF